MPNRLLRGRCEACSHFFVFLNARNDEQTRELRSYSYQKNYAWFSRAISSYIQFTITSTSDLHYKFSLAYIIRVVPYDLCGESNVFHKLRSFSLVCRGRARRRKCDIQFIWQLHRHQTNLYHKWYVDLSPLTTQTHFLFLYDLIVLETI